MNRQPITAILAAALLLAAGAATAAEASEGLSDGIKVHGHWKIEVFEPDGTLVSINEVENALTSNGAAILSSILTLENVLGGWAVVLADIAGDQHPCSDGSSRTTCGIVQVGVTDFILNPNSLNLVVGDGNGAQVTLTGSVTADYDGSIDTVLSAMKWCGPTLTPLQCMTSPGNPIDLTQKTLATPVSVLAGQIIQVTVTISFS